MDGLRFRVLGQLEVAAGDGRLLPLRGSLQRRLLGALLLHVGQVVPADPLVEAVWGGSPPRDVAGSFHTHVFRLRQLLGADLLQTDAGGYRLVVPRSAIDAAQLEDAVAATATPAGDVTAVLAALDDAVALWRGPPYDSLADWDDARIEAVRLRELWLQAREERFELLLSIGRHTDAIPDLQALCDAEPLRERPCDQLMRALAAAARIPDALRAFDAFRRHLGAELGLDPSRALKAREAALLASRPDDGVVAHVGDDRKPVPRGLTAARSTLPRPLSEVVGRADDLAAVGGALRRCRLVTLVGTAGVGKTRLALAVAPDRAEALGQVWFCELANATTPDAVEHLVAATVGVDRRADAGLVDGIVTYLATQQGLLVVDNCEHVIEAAATLVERIVRETDGITVLATSRERLAVDGELVHVVQPLTVPVDAAHGGAAAVELFVARVRSVRPEFAIDATNAGTVVEICRRLDGVPLAIELAAARVHGLGLDDIVRGLDHRFRLLTSGSRTSTRHRSLRAAIDWSYASLDDAQRSVLEQVSVCSGGFDVAAAAAIAEVPTADAEAVLADLVERSLVVRVDRGGPSRFSLLESIRLHGADRLAARSGLDAAEDRHARHYVALARAADRMLPARGGHVGLDVLDTDLANLRAAHHRLRAREAIGPLFELTIAMHHFAVLRMRPEVLEWAAAAAALPGAAQHPLFPAVLASAALGAWKRGDFDRAAAFTEQAQPAERAGADVGPLVSVAADLALLRGDLAAAIAGYDRALAHGGRDDVSTTMVAGTRVLALAYGGDRRQAAVDAESLVAVVERRGNLLELSWARYCLGEVLLEEDPPRARRELEQALAAAATTGSAFVAGVAGVSAASLEARHGDARVAAAQLRGLIDHYRRAGVWSVLWTMLRTVTHVLATLGADGDAAHLLGAVAAPRTGAEAFGDDATRLRALSSELRARVGDAAFEAAVAEGAAAADDEVVSRAAAALDGVV